MRSRSLVTALPLLVALAACGADDDFVPPADAGGDDATASDGGATDATMVTDATVTDGSHGGTSDGSAGNDGGTTADASEASDASDAGDAGDAADAADAAVPHAVLTTTIGAGVTATAVTINQGTAIGEGSANGATPFTLTNLATDPNNTQTIVSATNPFLATGTVPDTAAGFCDYTGATPKRVSYVTGAKFEDGSAPDPQVPMAPFYFPLVYTSANTTSGNAVGGAPPILGVFDWRPKDLDEAVVVAESDDHGKTWYFMQTVLELFPDLTNPASGGYSPTATATGCPSTLQSTNSKATSANGSTADDGWGHASILQLPGVAASTGQFLYLLDRKTTAVDSAPLHVIQLTSSTNKFPIDNTNSSAVGANDVKSIATALTNTAGAASPVVVQDSVGLLQPDGIVAVFPTAPGAAAGSPVTVMYVQKILDGDDTGATALPAAQQCGVAPVSGNTNHDISNVRLATTTDGVHFTDLGIVQGLNDPTTVDITQTRWISPRATLLDVNGDGSVWGLYFSGGNCLDGDSDAFHFLGYAESTDKMSWTVFNDVTHPIASINTITTTNPATGAVVTIPAVAPVVPTEPWFAERLYAPTATQIDPTHLSLTFAGYGVQTPKNDLLDYRQIGNVVVTVSKALPLGVPNNINAH